MRKAVNTVLVVAFLLAISALPAMAGRPQSGPGEYRAAGHAHFGLSVAGRPQGGPGEY